VDFLTDPWTWWVAPFTNDESMRLALYAGLLAVVSTSVVGVWVVLRGMSFFGDALAHGVLPGIAIAFVVGGNTTFGAVVSALVMIGGISMVKSHSPLPEDVSIGILFIGMLALAVAIISSNTGSSVDDLDRFLFGSVTGVDGADLLRQAIAAVVAVVGVVVLHRALLALTFDEASAGLIGLKPRLTHGVLLALVALAIIASFKTVGNLLVFAFLVAPPATATLIVRRVHRIMVVAVLLGWVSIVVGLLVSFHRGTAAGASMALSAVTLFFVVLAGKSFVGSLRNRRMAMAVSV